jgi:hypothetical protein
MVQAQMQNDDGNYLYPVQRWETIKVKLGGAVGTRWAEMNKIYLTANSVISRSRVHGIVLNPIPGSTGNIMRQYNFFITLIDIHGNTLIERALLIDLFIGRASNNFGSGQLTRMFQLDYIDLGKSYIETPYTSFVIDPALDPSLFNLQFYYSVIPHKIPKQKAI